MIELQITANNFGDWLKELEEYENKKPEDMYCVKVSAALLCKILRAVIKNDPMSELSNKEKEQYAQGRADALKGAATIARTFRVEFFKDGGSGQSLGLNGIEGLAKKIEELGLKDLGGGGHDAL